LYRAGQLLVIKNHNKKYASSRRPAGRVDEDGTAKEIAHSLGPQERHLKERSRPSQRLGPTAFETLAGVVDALPAFVCLFRLALEWNHKYITYLPEKMRKCIPA